MVTYDASVIESFAEALYAQAKSIVIRYTILGGLIGFGIGYAIANNARGDGTTVGAVVAVAGAILGFMQGQSKAFALRLQAQTALCQVQVEKNTRGVAGERAA
jgi:hypothetical protein